MPPLDEVNGFSPITSSVVGLCAVCVLISIKLVYFVYQRHKADILCVVTPAGVNTDSDYVALLYKM